MTTYWTLTDEGDPPVLIEQDGFSVRRWSHSRNEWFVAQVHLAAVMGLERDGKLERITAERMQELIDTEGTLDVTSEAQLESLRVAQPLDFP